MEAPWITFPTFLWVQNYLKIKSKREKKRKGKVYLRNLILKIIQIKFLMEKTTISKKKKQVDRINLKIRYFRRKISEFEDTAIENIQNETLG